MRLATVYVQVEYPVVVQEWVEVKVEYDIEHGEIEPSEDAILNKVKDELDPLSGKVSVQDFDRDSFVLANYNVTDLGDNEED